MNPKSGFSVLVFLILAWNIGFANHSTSELKDKENNLLFNDIFSEGAQDNCPVAVDNNSISTTSENMVCSGETVSFTGSEPDVTPNRDSTFRWQRNTTGVWQDISGASNKDYTAFNLTETTSFRRLVDFKGCNDIFPSNEITITIVSPTLAVTRTNPQNCGELGTLDFTFTDVPDGNYTIFYDGGNFTNVAVSGNAATVQADAGRYSNLRIEVSGCSSENGTSATISEPNAPNQPTVAIENRCGESILTASNYTGDLLWNTGETTETITVTEEGDYSVTQTINGCTSNEAVVTASPRLTPSLTVQGSDPLVCQGLGTLNFTFTNVPNGFYTINYDAGNFTGVLVADSKAIVLTPAGAYNNLKITIDGCTSPDGINISLSDPNPPPTPKISVDNQCGESILTASGYSGQLNWSTGETTKSITVTEANTYSVTQTLNGCTSEAATATASPKEIPKIEVSVNDPEVCGGTGTISFTFTGVPNGTYTIAYDGGEFTGVNVSNNSATVDASTGSYRNLKITANGCTSAAGIHASLSDPNPPNAPNVTVENGCGSSTLTATNYNENATLEWSTGDTGESITVTETGNYSVTQTLGGCTSIAATVKATPKAIPTIAAKGKNPEVCQGEGSIDFTFSGVPDGTYTIYYDAGSFSAVTVSGNKATVAAGAGIYNNLTISVGGCASENGVDVSLFDPNAPDAPVVKVQNNCGESVLTATQYEQGAKLNWSTGGTGESITVTDSKTYSVTQTLSGCTSSAATVLANPKPIPDAPDFSVTNNCDGTSVLTATDYENGATLEWSNGASTRIVTISTAGSYSLSQIVDGCKSAVTTKTAAPKTKPTLAVSENDPVNCGENGSLDFTFTGVPNGTYDIAYDGGSFKRVSVKNNAANVSAKSGSYQNLTITVNDCTSDNGVNASLKDPNAPAAPKVTVENNCGESVLTISSFNPDATLEWNTGATTKTITVKEAGTYQATQTLNGCTSNAAVAVAAPKSIPPAPDFTVVDNCDKTSTLTATDIEQNATLEWSTGESSKTIEVTEAGNYSLSQKLNGCSSEATTKKANPKTAPVIAVTEKNPEECQKKGSLKFTFTGVPNGVYNIYYDGGMFRDVSVSSGTATVSALAGTYNNINITLNECTSANGVNATLTDPNAPEPPTIAVENFCGKSVLTATAYDTSAALLWNTGETGKTITVTDGGVYKLTLDRNGCTSNATVTATPYTIPPKPTVNVLDSCGGTVVKVKNYDDNFWLVWEGENQPDSIQGGSTFLTDAGGYTIHMQSDGCVGQAASFTANPLPVPAPPVSGGDLSVCYQDELQVLVAEASAPDANAEVVWFDQPAGGNIVPSPELDTIGTITYYAESQDVNSGCASPQRTAVTLSIQKGEDLINMDNEVLGKPESNVSVLVFTESSFNYQWYLNDTPIAGANKQYYYIPAGNRKDENVFSVQVETEGGCKAIFGYNYSGNLSSGKISGTDSFFNSEKMDLFIIYPNPADEKLYLSLNPDLVKNSLQLTVKIFSVNGSCVVSKNIGKTTETFNTGRFAPGLYSVAIFNELGLVDSKKLLISR